MPRSTYEHRFELQVLQGCCARAIRLFGQAGTGHGFHASFDADGREIEVYSQVAFPDFRERLPQGPSRLLFDPFDGPAATWVAWEGFTQEQLERALNIPLTPPRAPAVFPMHHGVMF